MGDDTVQLQPQQLWPRCRWSKQYQSCLGGRICGDAEKGRLFPFREAAGLPESKEEQQLVHSLGCREQGRTREFCVKQRSCVLSNVGSTGHSVHELSGWHRGWLDCVEMSALVRAPWIPQRNPELTLFWHNANPTASSACGQRNETFLLSLHLRHHRGPTFPKARIQVFVHWREIRTVGEISFFESSFSIACLEVAKCLHPADP